MSPYKPRVIDEELARTLQAMGAVVIEGPKACGKTATARQLARSEVLLDLEANARQAATVVPDVVLDGNIPRLIDEWQLVPEIWTHVRRAVDDRGQPGQFILTGSSVPPDDITRHSGAGRISRLHMRTMSLYETSLSNGTVSLADLLDGTVSPGQGKALAIRDLADEIVRGGWPGFRDLSLPDAERAVRDYLGEIVRVDISQVDQTRRDPARVRRLVRSLARNVATYTPITTLAADTGGSDGPIDRDTASDYLSALRRLMVVEDQPAWAVHLRSRYNLRSAEKRLFVDPSLAVAAMSGSPKKLLNDLNLFGLLFESLVIRDLRIYAQASDASVLQYRDSDGLEIDTIVEAVDGRWAAFEVKLGGEGLIDEAAASLRKFGDRIDTKKCGDPAVLGVIIAAGYTYIRPDGIAVIPVTALRP